MAPSSLDTSMDKIDEHEKELGTGRTSINSPTGSDTWAQDEEKAHGRHVKEDELADALKTVPVTVPGPALEPPPDGGWFAWTQVLYGHFVVMNCWGWVQSFGVFQTYYVTALHETASSISWIGSIQIFLLFSTGMFSGRMLDAGFFKVTFFTGLSLQMLGVFTLSVGTKYWHILLSAIAQGIGCGMTFTPTVAILSTYFTKRRSLVIGMAASGSGIGGLIYPSIVRSLLPKIGYGWTVRVCGFVMLCVGLTAGLGLKTRIPPRKSGPLLELGAFRELPYTLYCIAAFLFFFGIFFPFYYSSSFARDIVGMSYDSSAEVLMMMNGIGVISRILPNWLADKYTGPIGVLVPCLFGTAVCTYAWAAIKTKVGIWIWAVFYGFFAGGVQGVFPSAMSSLTSDPTKQGTRIGMGFTIASIGALVGSPLGGALIQARHGGYLYAQMWSASSIFAGGCFTLAARLVKMRIDTGRISFKALFRR
ncbi:MFS general substrate transporter [Microthyrium microscopicum]|uniref:MFS general substrate transporter n=1 Tax=Microthyrium microscopicum TaxID=703497 RepID=A0A6A6UGW8_9PEZI|nr:MFS general substrate transporter [Microthyrium microscopicum]